MILSTFKKGQIDHPYGGWGDYRSVAKGSAKYSKMLENTVKVLEIMAG
jgi:hypothetical protein